MVNSNNHIITVFKTSTIKNYTKILFYGVIFIFLSCSNSDENLPAPNPQGEIPDVVYSIPESDNDGWLVGDLGITDLKKTVLLNGVDKIGRGTYGEIHSILIIKDKKLVLEKYYAGRNSNGQFINFDRFTKHEVQSASKSFRSMLTGIAIEKGFIEDKNKLLFSFFPEYISLNNELRKDKITLEDILTMCSGLEWDEWSYPFGDPKNNLSTMYSMPANKWVEYVLSRPAKYEPGTTFAYSTGASLMLKQIVDNSIDIDIRTFTKQYYSNLVEDPSIDPYSAGMTPREMAKLGYIYLYGGKWKNNQIISQNWIEQSLQKRFQVNSEMSYGYQWWMRTLKTTTSNYNIFYANGNGGQFVIVIKDLDIVIVSTGGKFGTAGNEIFNLIEQHILPAFEN